MENGGLRFVYLPTLTIAFPLMSHVPQTHEYRAYKGWFTNEILWNKNLYIKDLITSIECVEISPNGCMKLTHSE